MARVYLESISRVFQSVIAVADITFEVPDGEFWVLVGPSGCGKSTILRTIAGLEPITSGHLYIGDRLVNHISARQRDVAMVFQNYALYPHMTVAENLAFGLKMRRTEAEAVRKRVEAVAQSLNITHLLDRRPRQLSGGQQQRVALGRALVRQPQVFLLDEPLSNLDAQLREGTRAELKQLHQRFGVTTIYVTHDQVEAMTLADQIVVLQQGRIQQIGSPQSLYAHPANQMVATFLGNPPMNVLPAINDGGALQLGGQSIPCPSPWLKALEPGRSLNIGIRPEHLTLANETHPAHLTVEVTVVEPLGRESLVRTELPDSLMAPPPVLNLQIPAGWLPHPGDRLSLSLDISQLVAFDPATGDRLID